MRVLLKSSEYRDVPSMGLEGLIIIKYTLKGRGVYCQYISLK